MRLPLRRATLRPEHAACNGAGVDAVTDVEEAVNLSNQPVVRQPQAPRRPSAPSAELLTAFRLISAAVQTDVDVEFTPVASRRPALSAELLMAFRLISAAVETDVDAEFTPVASRRPALSVELLMAFRLLSGVVQTNAAEQVVRAHKQPATLSLELVNSFRGLSSRAAAEALAARNAVEAKKPEEGADDHSVLVEAAEVDVASVARAIDGVRKITREVGGLWLVAADRDIRPILARQLAGRGALTLLMSRAARRGLPVRSRP
ncbi:MAG: hypothetical protein JO339_03425 [Alphaproteobacteria bacterium]|nr:hypothetical protein [Alphaproteobacteria bacterium]